MLTPNIKKISRNKELHYTALKKEDLSLATNYCGVNLSSRAAKIHKKLFSGRIRPVKDVLLPKNQKRYREQSSTTSQVLAFHCAVERLKQRQ